MSDPSPIVLRTATGQPLALSADEQQLALLWLADFGGEGDAAWDGLAAATAYVVDGAAKLALVRARVQPLAEHLPPVAQQATALDRLMARYWFRNGACAVAPRGPDDAAEAR